MRDKEELKGEVKIHKTWNGGSLVNDYFTDPVFIKPVILDEWSMKRVQMPERAYKKFFFCNDTSSNNIIVKQKPFNYGSIHSREFTDADDKMFSEHFREVLQEQKKKYIDYVERPSKYEPQPSEPLCLSRTSKYYKFDPVNKAFGNSTHTSWEQF